MIQLLEHIQHLQYWSIIFYRTKSSYLIFIFYNTWSLDHIQQHLIIRPATSSSAAALDLSIKKIIINNNITCNTHDPITRWSIPFTLGHKSKDDAILSTTQRQKFADPIAGWLIPINSGHMPKDDAILSPHRDKNFRIQLWDDQSL